MDCMNRRNILECAKCDSSIDGLRLFSMHCAFEVMTQWPSIVHAIQPHCLERMHASDDIVSKRVVYDNYLPHACSHILVAGVYLPSIVHDTDHAFECLVSTHASDSN